MKREKYGEQTAREEQSGQISRRELIKRAALLTISGAALSSVQHTFAAEDTDYWSSSPIILGYFPSWSNLDPALLNLGEYTHICHAFTFAEQGSPLLFPSDTQTKTLIQAAHAKHIKVLLSLGGADSNKALSDLPPEALSDSLVKQVKEYQYDGIDVDWESPDSDDQSSKITVLVQMLRDKLPDSILTMAIPSGSQWFQVEKLLPLVNWFNVMTYDFYGPWSNIAGYNASMTDVKGSIADWQGRGLTADKILLGIPDYGRRIHAAHFGDPAPFGSYFNGEISYIDVQKFEKQGWKKMFDKKEGAAYLVNPAKDELITYDSMESARLKGEYARSNSLLGYFLWEITSDFDGKTHALARAALNGWKHTKRKPLK